VLTLAVLYVTGRVTSQVIGASFRLFETTLERLPFVAKCLRRSGKLLDT